jgi:hypothetical protein
MNTNPGDELTLIEMTRRFSTEESAREYFERLLWPNGPVCRHCGNADQAPHLEGNAEPGQEDTGRASTSARSAARALP